MKKLDKGLWPVMLTPFKENNELDLPALERLTEFYLHTGANGLFANCLSSEMFQLTNKERLSVIKTVLKVAKGRVPVVATGTFGKNWKDNIKFIKKVYDAGGSAVIINTSQLTEQAEEEDAFKKQLEIIINHTSDIPLGTYECPEPHKRLISPSLMKWLADTGRFLYHKDTSCDFQSIKDKLKAIKKSSFGLYNAHAPTGLQSLQKGARGISPIGANFYPELFSYLINNYTNKKKANQVKKINAFICEMDLSLHEFYPLSAKLFLKKRGLQITLNTRIPLPEMNNEDINKLNKLMNIFHEISETIGQPLVI